jgi:hypothetical protein
MREIIEATNPLDKNGHPIKIADPEIDRRELETIHHAAKAELQAYLDQQRAEERGRKAREDTALLRILNQARLWATPVSNETSKKSPTSDKTSQPEQRTARTKTPDRAQNPEPPQKPGPTRANQPNQQRTPGPARRPAAAMGSPQTLRMFQMADQFLATPNQPQRFIENLIARNRAYSDLIKIQTGEIPEALAEALESARAARANAARQNITEPPKPRESRPDSAPRPENRQRQQYRTPKTIPVRFRDANEQTQLWPESNNRKPRDTTGTADKTPLKTTPSPADHIPEKNVAAHQPVDPEKTAPTTAEEITAEKLEKIRRRNRRRRILAEQNKNRGR